VRQRSSPWMEVLVISPTPTAYSVYSELRRVVYSCKQREKGDAAALVARPPCQRGPGPHPGSLTGNGKYKAHRLVIQKGVLTSAPRRAGPAWSPGATKKRAFPELSSLERPGPFLWPQSTPKKAGRDQRFARLSDRNFLKRQVVRREKKNVATHHSLNRADVEARACALSVPSARRGSDPARARRDHGQGRPQRDRHRGASAKPARVAGCASLAQVCRQLTFVCTRADED